MERIFEVSAGIDVHRDKVLVSVRRVRNTQEEVKTKTFETFHDGLTAMAEWLLAERVEVVGMESTGVYWHPVVTLPRFRGHRRYDENGGPWNDGSDESSRPSTRPRWLSWCRPAVRASARCPANWS